MAYNKYPGLDDDLKLPPAVLQKIADSDEIEKKIAEGIGTGGEGLKIQGVLNPGEVPTKPGIWARRITQ